ncbi:MAG: hypothetical protein NTU95_10875 [Methanothrix sp.]|nr:hypothetical protein [Methanothrix sp.]
MVLCFCQCAAGAKSVGVVGPYTITFDIGNFEVMWPQNTVTGTTPIGNGFTMYKTAFLGGYVYIIDYQDPITFNPEEEANSQFPNGPDGSTIGTIDNMQAVIAWGTSPYYRSDGVDQIATLSYQIDADTKAMLVVLMTDQSRGNMFINAINTIKITRLSQPTAESLGKAAQALANANAMAENNRIAVDNFQPWGAGNHEFGPGSH